MAEIHIGKALHDAALVHKMKIVDIVQAAGYTSQSTFYKHIGEPNLPFRTLYKYAKVMEYYFDSEIPEFKTWIVKNGLSLGSPNKLGYSELEKERDYWKDKYYALLERYNSLLEKRS